jgi:hypothetical protein
MGGVNQPQSWRKNGRVGDWPFGKTVMGGTLVCKALKDRSLVQ